MRPDYGDICGDFPNKFPPRSHGIPAVPYRRVCGTRSLMSLDPALRPNEPWALLQEGAAISDLVAIAYEE